MDDNKMAKTEDSAQSEALTGDNDELTLNEISELVEEATMLRWSSKPTTSSKRCC